MNNKPYVFAETFSILVFFSALLLTPAAARAGDIISNGTVMLGVNDAGHLNFPGGSPSEQGETVVGLRFVPTNAESTADGCKCEGWGAADATSGVSGFANEDTDGGANNIAVESFVVDASKTTATSIVRIPGGEGSVLRVTHFYHPSSTPNLYQADVTIENISATTVDLRYRRVMDWDIEPTAFSEFVTINRGTAADLEFTSDNGFATANPLDTVQRAFDLNTCGLDADFTDCGPADHGALFDFNFGALAPGAKKEFRIFYGAAATEAEANAALSTVGAEAFSFGQPSTTDGPSQGTPNTFIFAFAGIGGAPVFNRLALTPKTATNPVGTEHCVVATVTNQNNEPLVGVRVDFNVTGVNPNAGFRNTDTKGQAQFCYTGTTAGQDTITASFGDISNTATKDWTEVEDNTPPVAELQPVVTTPEDTSKLITLTGTDADGDSLTFIIVTNPAHGTLSAPTPATNAQQSKARSQLKARLQKERKIRGSSASKLSRKELAALIQSLSANNVTYTPHPNYNGPDSFTFKVNDGHANSAPAIVSITVTPVHDAPEIQSLGFERRTSGDPGYLTPGIAAVLKFLNVDGDDSVSLRVSLLKAKNVPKGCGANVIASDEVSLFPFNEVVPLGDDPDSADPTRSEGELKTVEIGPQAMQAASDQGCQVTLQVTQFTVNRTGSPVNFSGSACIDSDSNEITTPCTGAPTTLSSRQLRSSGALRKIAPPAVR